MSCTACMLRNGFNYSFKSLLQKVRGVRVLQVKEIGNKIYIYRESETKYPEFIETKNLLFFPNSKNLIFFNKWDMIFKEFDKEPVYDIAYFGKFEHSKSFNQRDKFEILNYFNKNYNLENRTQLLDSIGKYRDKGFWESMFN